MSRIAVIGAGIIGASIATRLIHGGHEVTVYEREPEGLPASAGNAALIALPEIAPMASPGVLASVPGWLVDPLGPLTVRWTDLPALTPWLVAFVRSATPGHGAHVRKALTSLMRTAIADHVETAAMAGLHGHLRQTGYLSLHDTPLSLSAALQEAEGVKAALGFDYAGVSPDEARRLIPQLEGVFAGAVHQPGYWSMSNPLTVLRHHQAFIRSRARFLPQAVMEVMPIDGGVGVRTAAAEATSFERVVICAGVWSRTLVRQLGLKVLLETERGYNTTYSDLSWSLPMPIGFADHGFVATPLVDGLRVGGAVELAQPQSPPNFARAQAMRIKMRQYIPSLPEGGQEWMGRRPSTPDSLPVIGHHPKDQRIIFAFGHGHLGLTLSGVTSRLVAGLMTGSVDGLEPFGISRFH